MNISQIAFALGDIDEKLIGEADDEFEALNSVKVRKVHERKLNPLGWIVPIAAAVAVFAAIVPASVFLFGDDFRAGVTLDLTTGGSSESDIIYSSNISDGRSESSNSAVSSENSGNVSSNFSHESSNSSHGNSSSSHGNFSSYPSQESSENDEKKRLFNAAINDLSILGRKISLPCTLDDIGKEFAISYTRFYGFDERNYSLSGALLYNGKIVGEVKIVTDNEDIYKCTVTEIDLGFSTVYGEKSEEERLALMESEGYYMGNIPFSVCGINNGASDEEIENVFGAPDYTDVIDLRSGNGVGITRMYDYDYDNPYYDERWIKFFSENGKLMTVTIRAFPEERGNADIFKKISDSKIWNFKLDQKDCRLNQTVESFNIDGLTYDKDGWFDVTSGGYHKASNYLYKNGVRVGQIYASYSVENLKKYTDWVCSADLYDKIPFNYCGFELGADKSEVIRQFGEPLSDLGEVDYNVITPTPNCTTLIYPDILASSDDRVIFVFNSNDKLCGIQFRG